MTSNRPYMPLWIADYLKDTRGLNAAQHGAYFLLIMEYWTHGSLPDDDKRLARIACMSAVEWKKTKLIVQAFFHDGWKHKRLDKEMAKFEGKQTARQTAGKRGGKTSANAKQTAKQNSSKTQASSSDFNSEPNGSADDPRHRLFTEGLETLAKLTGKGPYACRSFLGKCLKGANDDAITVLGVIEDAERNRVADPSAWIAAHFKGNAHGKAQGGSLIAALDKAIERSVAEDTHFAEDQDLVLGLPDGSVRRR